MFPAQREVTLGAANAGPVIGPVVLNEIHYQPAGGEAEFVEIRNITDAAVPLFDPRHPGNTGRIAGINFQFPPDVTLPPGGLAVVTAGDPDSFRAHYRSTAERIAQRLAAGVARGELRAEVDEVHAWAIMGMNVFLGLRFGVWDEDRDPGEVADAVAEFLRRGLAR